MTASAERGAHIPKWTLGDRLRRIRRDMRIEQAEFADMLEVGLPTYSAWESGRTTPRNVVAVARRVEVATRVPAGWLLGVMDGSSAPPDTDPDGPVTEACRGRVLAAVTALPGAGLAA